MKKKTFEKYEKITKRPCISENEIIYFRKMLANYLSRSDGLECAWDGQTNRQKASYLLTKLQSSGPKHITQEQSEKGLEWLKRKILKVNGEIRNSKTLPFERWNCVRVLNIMKNFSHWTFDGLHEESNGYYRAFYPIYTMHSETGETFTYVPTSQGNVIMECAS